MLTFDELLKNRNLDLSQKVLMVRHKDKRVSIFDLIEKQLFIYYQSQQSKKVFENCKYLISFIGLESTKALFYNIYEIKGIKDIQTVEWPDDFKKNYPQFVSYENSFYEMEVVEGFEDLTERVIIEWGQGALAWVQNYSIKDIIEILPEGYVKEFKDYLNFTLSYFELKKLYKYPSANKLWKDKLSSVNGIYLILDRNTGKQYIGSAYGKDGIWGRWLNYSQTGHGENKMLLELLKTNERYVENFQWTILATLPSNLTKDEVIEYETMYKNKLGSKVFGLNAN